MRYFWRRGCGSSTEKPSVDGGSLALQSRCLEFIALLPADEPREACRLPAESESEARHRRIADEIHLGMVLIAGLVVMLLRVFLVLRQTPGLVVAFELHAFIDRERWNAHAGQTEMIGAIEVSSLGARIGTDRQPELFGHRLHPGIERGPLRP